MPIPAHVDSGPPEALEISPRIERLLRAFGHAAQAETHGASRRQMLVEKGCRTFLEARHAVHTDTQRRSLSKHGEMVVSAVRSKESAKGENEDTRAVQPFPSIVGNRRRDLLHEEDRGRALCGTSPRHPTLIRACQDFVGAPSETEKQGHRVDCFDAKGNILTPIDDVYDYFLNRKASQRPQHPIIIRL